MARFCLVAVVGLCGCAGTARQVPPSSTTAPVHLEMEPMKIEARRGPTGLEIQAFDAAELFERAGAALSEQRHDEAHLLYTKLIDGFPESSFTRPAYYNRGLALRDKKNYAAAIDSFKALVEKYPGHPDSKDALFQMGACYAELGNWPPSAEIFARILERLDLNADDRIEAIARRGFAQFSLGDLDVAEKTFRSALAYKRQIENEERLATDFYLAFSQYHMGQIDHQRFRSVQLRLPETQMDRDMEEKARLLLAAQRAYIEAIKFGNPAWASAAGFQVGTLYEEFHEAFLKAPIPAELDAEAKEVYLDELRKKVRVLLEKSLRWQRENLLMIERLGVNTDWAEKSKLAYSKLLRLLDPAPHPDQPDDSGSAPPAGDAPKPPSPPDRAVPGPRDETGDEAAPHRQIL